MSLQSAEFTITIATFLHFFDLNNKSIDLHIPKDIQLKVNFHVVTISIMKGSTESFFNALENEGFAVEGKDSLLKKGNHAWYREYMRGQETIGILFGQRNLKKYLPRDLVKLYSPSPGLVDFIYSLVRDRSDHRLSEVEIAFDFYCIPKIREHFQSYLESIAYTKYQRKPSFVYWDHKTGGHSQYQSGRKSGRSSKDTKVYDKGAQYPELDEAGLGFLRMEITLARRFLKSRELNLLTDLPGIWNLKLSDFFGLKRIDYERLGRTLLKKRIRAFCEWARMRGKVIRGSLASIRRKRRMDLLNSHFGSWLNCFRPQYNDHFYRVDRFPVSEQVAELKKRKVEYSRFLDDVEPYLFSYLESSFGAAGKVWI